MYMPREKSHFVLYFDRFLKHWAFKFCNTFSFNKRSFLV